MKKLFFAIALVSLVLAGCLQEKKLDANTIAGLTDQPIAGDGGFTGGNEFIPSETPSGGSQHATPTPAGGAQTTPSPIPTPSPAFAPNCTILANPDSATGPATIILIVAFNRMPSDTTANIDCGPAGQSGSVTPRAAANGAISAFKSCSYPDVSSATEFNARASASGGFSCSKKITIRG